ncbi:UPF0481 protein At3g47200-like [Oryza brachyantha]|uniref:UPF0481 protein At3g47200-like n=1 Tax=Oryza brachyantha TaxID=4533 RepID=UPI001ADCA1F2|nr:UPF0481 protein At3g47200-like [Oryza brachyantha]
MSRGEGITVNLERMARRLMQRQEAAASDEERRMMVSTHRVSPVPAHLRDANPDAYTPRFVSVGPLHRGDARRLGAGERLKMAYLHSLISRGHPDQAGQLAVIQEYLRVVAARETDARAFYGEDVVMYADDFIQMLVLDGCFIIEHLANVAIGREEASLHATPFGPVQLSVDLILAENQIPFFVLIDLVRSTKLPEFASTGYSPEVLLMKLVLYYLAGEKGRDMGHDALPSAVDGIAHILHLLHATVTVARTKWEPPPRIQDSAVLGTAQEVARLLRRLPLLLLVPLLYPILPEESKWRASYGRDDVPSASDLKRMWVRFKKAPRGSGPAVGGIASVMGPVPLAVKLAHEDKLRLPQLRVELRTAALLLNLMAFEQSAGKPEAQDVSAYVSFMAKMVQSAEDAGALTASEVVVVVGGGGESKEEVVRLFRQVGAASGEVELERSYLGRMMVELRDRSRHPLFMMWADVKRNYFTVPWAVVAEFVAFVTFVSTIVQMYSSFKSK